jgi:hypothetical protein
MRLTKDERIVVHLSQPQLQELVPDTPPSAQPLFCLSLCMGDSAPFVPRLEETTPYDTMYTPGQLTFRTRCTTPIGPVGLLSDLRYIVKEGRRLVFRNAPTRKTERFNHTVVSLRCSACHEMKPASEFSHYPVRGAWGVKVSYCLSCRRAATRRWRARRPKNRHGIVTRKTPCRGTAPTTK